MSGRGPLGPDPRREVDDEVEDYLRRRTAELEAEGLAPDEARRRAESAFGDVDAVRQACLRIQERRQARRSVAGVLAAFAQDVRIGARALRRRPGFAAVAILTLGLGIGANTALFSVVDAVLLRPLPYPEPDRLVQLWESDPQRPTRAFSPADYLDLRQAASSFEALAAYTTPSANLTGDGTPESVRYASVSGNFFQAMGVAPTVGRAFGPDPVEPGVRVAVLSDDLWRRRYGGDPGVVGRTLLVDGAAYEILGVMPPGFDFPEGTSFWAAAPRDLPGSRFTTGDPTPMRDAWYHEVVGRLKADVGLARAGEDVDRVAAVLARDHPREDGGLRIRLVPLAQETLGDVAPTLWLLLGATGLVLLVACTNVANLLLARAVGRRRELAVRSALGAGRARVVAHVLAESLVLALAGGSAGAALAAGGLRLLAPTVSAVLPRGGEVHPSPLVFAYAVGAALVTALLFGLLPAVSSAARGAARSARGHTESAGGRRLGDALVAVEVAMAVVLVLGAGLLLRSIARVASVDLGFEAEHATVAWVGLPGAGERTPEERVSFYRAVGARLGALPGVAGVAWTQTSPLAGGPGAGLRIEDEPDTYENPSVDARWQVTSPEYFRLAGVRLLSGRLFTEADGADAEPVAVVNRTLARVAFGDADPVGRRINTGLDGREPGAGWHWVRVVGVVADTRNLGPMRAPDPAVFRPMAQGGPGFRGDRLMAFLRTEGEGPLPAAALREAVGEVNPDAPLYGVARAATLAGSYTGQQRLALLLLTVFGALALTLGAVGTYGVTAFAVGRRTRELGVRRALGAPSGRISRMVLGQALVPVGLGVVAGVAAGAALARLLGALLFEVAPLDPVTFSAVPLLLLAVSMAAVWVPARRAGRVDPVESLGAE